MKKFCIIVLLFTVCFFSCGKKGISEREFSVIWQEYLQLEFEESFDEKQSISQKEKILKELLEKYDLALEEFKIYMNKKHPEKYKKIFIK